MPVWPGRLSAHWRGCLAALLLGASATAQQSVTDEYSIGSSQGREVVVLPSSDTSSRMDSAFGPILGQSVETAAGRVHTVSFEGETFQAATPLEGPASRIVFDPAQRKFVALLPSIRVGLGGAPDLNAIADLLDAVRVTPFENLGLAIVDLPEAMHPADAIELLKDFPGQPGASLRLRGPPVEWR